MTSPAERRRAFRLLYLCLVTIGVGNSILFAVLPALAESIGLTEAMVAVIYVAPSALFVVASQMWGTASDRLGRRPVVLIGMVATAVSLFGFGAVAPIAMAGLVSAAWATALFAMTRLVFAAFGSGTSPSAQAYVADRTTPAQRTTALADLGAAFGLGAIVGPTLAGVLAPFIGIAGPFFVAGAISLAAALAVRVYLPERTPPKERLAGSEAARPRAWALAIDPRVRAITLVGALTWIVQAVQIQTLGYFVMDRMHVDGAAAAAVAGWVLTGGAAAMLVTQMGVIRLFRMTPRDATVTGAGLMAAGSLALVFAFGIVGIVVGYVISAAAAGLLRPGQLGVSSLAVTPREQGAVAGLGMAVAGMGFLVAPVGGLLLRDSFGPTSPYVVSTVLSVVAFGVAVVNPAIRRASRMAIEDTVSGPPAM
ncbi:MAG: MFS transporter [Caulobacterales bacterium]|nr:MFS transporter [Caulobacterales bacterium]